MKTPYTDNPLDALVTAQSSIGVLLSAALVDRPVRSPLASAPLLLGIWLCAIDPITSSLVKSLTSIEPSKTASLEVLAIAAGLGTVTMILAGRWWAVLAGAAGQFALWKVSNFVTDAGWELAVLHLTWLGALLGIARMWEPARERAREIPREAASARSLRWDDFIIGAAAFSIAVAICTVVLIRKSDSDDEWAYTWQAMVFAHGRASVPAYPCGDALRNFWIFFSEGRAFAQYTPGWPYFMVPFALLGVPWLAGPAAHGLLAVAVARLSRRALAATPARRATVDAAQLRAAGYIGALACTVGAAPLLNGSSRYAHTLVTLLFAASLELVCTLTFDRLDPRRHGARAMALGVATSWLLATRPGDGAVLGLGIFALYFYGLLRRRIAWGSVALTTAAFTVSSALTLAILRLQLGKWFTTGYSLAPDYYGTWATPRFSLPLPAEVKAGIPLATMAYCFWPASWAGAAAGLLAAKHESRAVAAALSLGTLALAVFYAVSELGRHDDFGYGNRFHLPEVVAMSVGTAVLVAQMIRPSADVSSRGWRGIPAPAAVALFAMVSGAIRIGPLVLATAHRGVWYYSSVERAVEAQGIHDAVVVAHKGEVFPGTLDVTRNPPFLRRLDVILAGEESPGDLRCLREQFPTRRFYRARGNPEVTLTPL